MGSGASGQRVGKRVGLDVWQASWKGNCTRLCSQLRWLERSELRAGVHTVPSPAEISRRLWLSHGLDLVIPGFNLQGQGELQLRYCGCRRLL